MSVKKGVGMITIDRKRAREHEDGGFYECTVKTRRQAQFLSTQIGQLPIDHQALIYIASEDLWVHHATLMMLTDIKVSKRVERSEAPDTDLTLEHVDYLFTDGGKLAPPRPPIEASPE
jgi:hypothetical protein